MSKVFLLGANKEIDTAVPVVKENQLLISYGYAMSQSQCVVYKVEYIGDKWSNSYQYHVIDLATKDIYIRDFITPLSKKFGIGTYYDDANPQFMDSFEVAILVQEAQAKAKAEADKEEEERKRVKEVETVGRKRFEEILPENAQAVIVARLKQDDSDSQTDYFSSRVVRTVILGFSTHKRDIFSEMRKYASNFEETAYLAEYNADYEHREKYSMGNGYYLGKSKYSGWIVEKVSMYSREGMIKEFAYTAGNEYNICIKKNTNTPPIDKNGITQGGCKLVEYSEKALAVFGDTKPIKEELKAMGGKFNSRLTLNGNRLAGWVFSKSQEKILAYYFGLN